MNCHGCSYLVHELADDIDDGVRAQCRRFPPVVFVLDGILSQAFPEANDRCGEYAVAPGGE